jgi:hypothetical protein
MQMEVARYWPVIRCIRPGDGGLKRRQILPKSKVKGGVRASSRAGA